MPLTSADIKDAEAIEEELRGGLEDASAPDYDDDTSTYNSLSRAIDEYYQGQRKTDASGKLTAPPATRTPAVVSGNPKAEEFDYHFEPSVAEVKTFLQDNPSLVKTYKLERWLQPGAAPQLSLPMNQDIGGPGVNVQEPLTFLDAMDKESAPYKAIAEHIWRQKTDQAKASGRNLKRYRDIHLVKGQADDFLKGGLEYNIDRRLAPSALGVANAYTMGAAGPAYDAAVERINRIGPTRETQALEEPSALSQFIDGHPSLGFLKSQDTGEQYTGVSDPLSGGNVGTDEAELQSLQLPTSQEVKDRSPGFYHTANMLAYGLPDNPTNLIQEGISNAAQYGAKDAAGNALTGPVGKAFISTVSGAIANTAEGAVRDTATGLQQGKSLEDIGSDVTSNGLPNFLYGGGASLLGDVAGQTAGHFRETFRRQNPDIRTLYNAGGDTSLIHGTKPSPEVEQYVREGTKPRPEGTPGALAADDVAPRIEQSMKEQDIANNKRIGDEMEAYYNHPAYSKLKVKGTKLVQALVEMAQKNSFPSPVTGTPGNINPGLVNSVSKELGQSPWAEPKYVPRAQSAALANQTGGVVVDIDTAQKMFGESAEPIGQGFEAVIIPKEFTARELTGMEEKVDRILKMQSDGEAPADPVYEHFNRALKDTRDEFPAWKDEEGNLVAPPVDEGPRQPYSQAADMPPPKNEGGPDGVEVLPNVHVEGPPGEAPEAKPGLGPGRPRTLDPFNQRKPVQPSSPLEAMAAPIDIRGTSLDPVQRPEGLLGVGPGQPGLPSNPFDPRLPTSRESINPQRTVDVQGGYAEPQYVEPEALPGAGPRRDPLRPQVVEPQEPVDVRGDYNEPPIIEAEASPKTERMPSGYRNQPTEEATPLSLLAGNKLAMDVPEAAAPEEALAGFPANKRVKLADVREKLGSMPREEQDKLLKDMQRKGELVLYRNDNPRDITAADKAAEMDVAGSPRHLVYFTPQGEKAPTSGPREPTEPLVRPGRGPMGPSASPREALTEAIRQNAAQNPNGALLLVREIREASGLGKKEFDDAALELAREGKVTLHHHDHVGSLDEAQRNALISDDKGKHYVGLAPRGSFLTPDESLPGPMAKDWADSNKETKEWFEDIVAPGRDARSGEAKRAGDLSEQRKAFDEAEGQVRTLEDRLGALPEKDRLQSVLNILSEKLGREVTKEDLIRAGIISAGAAASLSDDETAEDVGSGAMFIGGLGKGLFGKKKGTPSPSEAPKPKRPTQPEATLDDGRVVRGFSAMRRQQSESKKGLETAMKRLGVTSERTLRDRLIDFGQSNNKQYDDALKAEAEKLGLTEDLWRVPAAAQQVEMERNRSVLGGSPRGVIGRIVSGGAPRLDKIAGVLSGAGRNPYAKGPDGLLEELLYAGVRNPARELLNLTGGRVGARFGDDIQQRILDVLSQQYQAARRKVSGEDEDEKGTPP